MRALIDTNIIVDVLVRRKEFFDESYAVARLAAEGRLDAIIPAGSIADVYYIIRKSGKNPAAARDAIATLIQFVHVCDTTASDVNRALSLGIPDFEDAILAETARREKAECIITRNERDFGKSPVPALSPGAFLSRWVHV